MSLTASRVPGPGSSTVVMKMPSSACASPANAPPLMRPLQPGARQLAVDDLGEELLDLSVAADLHVAVLVSVPPVVELSLLGKLVEVGAGDRELEARVLGLTLRD